MFIFYYTTVLRTDSIYTKPRHSTLTALAHL